MKSKIILLIIAILQTCFLAAGRGVSSHVRKENVHKEKIKGNHLHNRRSVQDTDKKHDQPGGDQPGADPKEEHTEKSPREPTNPPKSTKPPREPTNPPKSTKPPREKPTRKPVEPAPVPTKETPIPTKNPTKKPTKAPTKKPRKKPTKAPTKKPRKKPTKAPTKKQTEKVLVSNGCLTCTVAIGILAATNSTPNAVNLWLTEQNSNAAGSPTMLIHGTECALHFIFKSSVGNDTEAAILAEGLIKNDNVLAIVGLEYSSLAILVGEVANTEETPMITATSTHANVTLGRPYVFRTTYTIADEARVLALLGRQVLNATTAAILFQNDLAYSSELASGIKEAWELQGGSVVSEISFNQSNIQDSSYEDQVAELAGTAADVLFLPILSAQVPDIVYFIRQAVLTPIIGGDSWDDLNAIEQCGRDCIGSFYASLLSAYNPINESKQFVESYNSTYGVVPDATATLSYDSMNLLKDALMRYGKPTCNETVLQDREGIRDSLKNTSNFVGIGGNITFDDDNNPADVCVDINLVTEAAVPTYYYSVCGE